MNKNLYISSFKNVYFCVPYQLNKKCYILNKFIEIEVLHVFFSLLMFMKTIISQVNFEKKNESKGIIYEVTKNMQINNFLTLVYFSYRCNKIHKLHIESITLKILVLKIIMFYIYVIPSL